jgi:putative addiction module killer protein
MGRGIAYARIRVYLTRKGMKLVLLLAGGSKKTQRGDIAKARALAKELSNGS